MVAAASVPKDCTDTRNQCEVSELEAADSLWEECHVEGAFSSAGSMHAEVYAVSPRAVNGLGSAVTTEGPP